LRAPAGIEQLHAFRVVLGMCYMIGQAVSRGKGEQMKKGYWIVAYRSVSDESALKEYGKLAIPAIKAGGGKALIRTADAIEPREAGLKQRIVVMEFESFEKAVAAYNSAAYQAALKALGSGAERDFRIVEGVD
jgi:uncharacterized protein (DUF1330 family)